MTASPRAELTSVRLTRFKSFVDAELPLGDLTVLTGRNSSGKSNALDAIEVLARLAEGERLADALDGRTRPGGPVRGGSAGCAPHGETEFSIGCTVRLDGESYDYDVTIQVRPDLRVLAERLHGPRQGHSADGEPPGPLFAIETPDGEGPQSKRRTYLRGKGVPFRLPLSADRAYLATMTMGTPAPVHDEVVAALRGAQAVIAALRGTFYLDPVPHLMRSYVPATDAELRRTGENLSASVGLLAEHEPEKFRRLNELVRLVADHPVQSLGVAKSDLGDVMLTIREGDDPGQVTPARELSDGLLRFLAVAVALLTADGGLDVDAGNWRNELKRELTGQDLPVRARVLLVIEELENGLHPSMAARLLALIRETSAETGARVILTTHSPALLNALSGDGASSVVVCYRDRETQRSDFARLTEMPGYAQAMAQGRIGDLVSQGRLVRPEESSADPGALLHLLGIE